MFKSVAQTPHIQHGLRRLGENVFRRQARPIILNSAIIWGKKRRCSHAYEEHYSWRLWSRSFRELSATDRLDTNNVRLLAAEHELAAHFDDGSVQVIWGKPGQILSYTGVAGATRTSRVDGR